jgi:hypothetical protein
MTLLKPFLDHQARIVTNRKKECWSCGEKRPLSELDWIPFDNGIADEEAFYCIDSPVCQRRSEILKRWIR